MRTHPSSMNLCGATTWARPDPPTGDVDGGPAVDRRYRLTTPPGTPDGLWGAVDTRLGRRVLLQYGTRTVASGRLASRLATVDHPGVVRLLDAGEDLADDGVRRAFAVFPASDAEPFDAVGPERWGRLDLGAVAGVLAWLVSATVAVRAVCGPIVALCSSDLVVDPGLFDGDAPADGCPLHWMPSLAERDDDLSGVIATVLAARSRWEQLWLAEAVTLASSIPGRPRAVRVLAAVAGLDPRVLGLPPHVPRHAGPERRPFGRRLSVGALPTTTRTERTCVSVEVFS